VTRYFALLAAAYGLLAIESSQVSAAGLFTPHGSFVWMLLPWLATLPNSKHAVLAAAMYGLMLDALSNHHPGLLMASTIVATCVLQRVITSAALETLPRVFVVSFACGSLMAMLVATCSILAGGSYESSVVLAGSIAASSVFAAVVATVVVGVFRSGTKSLMPVQGSAH
jgi:hypothetical protein